MSASVMLPKNDPRMVAWKAYQKTDEYKNTRKWSLVEAHVDGSLWAAFETGFRAAVASHTSALAERDAEIASLRGQIKALSMTAVGAEKEADEAHAENARLREVLKPFRKVAGFLFERNYNASDIVLDMTLERKGKGVFLRAGDFFPVATALKEPTP